MRLIFFSKILISLILCLALTSCLIIPPDILKPSEGYLEQHQLQMRQYDTKDEETIILAVAGVLQDLGFDISESESKLGLIVGSKQSDAINKAQATGACLLDFAGAIAGAQPTFLPNIDAVQRIKVSIITKPSNDENRTVVRVTFQRVVLNLEKKVKRVETLSDPDIYQRFYDALSKSIFLEAHKI